MSARLHVRTKTFFERSLLFLSVSMVGITLVSVITGGQLSVIAFGQDKKPEIPIKSSQDHSVQDKEVSDAIETLKERASAQQTMIATLITITGLYAAILSLVAYTRLQQMKEDTKDAINDNSKRINDAIEALTTQVTDLGNQVRADIPAIHGIGRKLEELLAQMERRLPVDADLTTQDKYGIFSSENFEQTAIDEMVINSLDIFNIKNDAAMVRTVSRLYSSLGQFYFVRSTYHRSKKDSALADGSFRRATIYAEKAMEIDPNDPVAWRVRGAIVSWEAQTLKENMNSPEYDKKLLGRAQHYFSKSLELDKQEPGALDGMAWYLSETGQHLEAVEYSSNIISSAQTMRLAHQRKYLLFAYPNRAKYRGLAFIGLPENSHKQETETIVIQAIRDDFKDGFDLSRKLSAQQVYKNWLSDLIGSHIGFASLCTKHKIISEIIEEVAISG